MRISVSHRKRKVCRNELQNMTFKFLFYFLFFFATRELPWCATAERIHLAVFSVFSVMIGLFCKRALQKRQYSAKETYWIPLMRYCQENEILMSFQLLYVSVAKEPYKRDNILQKRLIEFSRVSSLLFLLGQMTIWLVFENFATDETIQRLMHWCHNTDKNSQQSQRSTQNDFRADFWEFLHRRNDPAINALMPKNWQIFSKVAVIYRKKNDLELTVSSKSLFFFKKMT